MPRSIAVIATLVFLLFPALARADDNFATRLANAPNAPVALTNCAFDDGENLAVSATNRTTYDLQAFRVGIRYYDASGKMIGQASQAWQLSSDPVVSGDQTAQHEQVLYALQNIDPSRIAYVICRVESAVFAGRKAWRYGHPWKGKLLPLQSFMIDNDAKNSLTSNFGAATRRKDATIRILAAWNDTSAGMTYVHDRIAITAKIGTATIKPIDVVLRMRMANGRTLSLPAIGAAAPTYQKFNPVSGNDEATPEVDPSSDLGALGSVTVPQGGTAVVVATFVIPGEAANPNDNKQVALR